ncbi:hypothetical protein ACGFJC_47035 [Nonomuraea fuscirosea]|uniref:hypothetical protein n=1 Tax=Nonomuraea fuscirosea TaxID=1291556 RepID=UPI003723C024
MAISDDEFTAMQNYAAYAAGLARDGIIKQLTGVPLTQDDQAFIARSVRRGDGDALAGLLAKLCAHLSPPANVTVTRYEVDNSELTAWRHAWVERREHTDLFVIARGTWSDAELWNFTLGDWHNPWRDDSYDADHYERPKHEAIAKARQIVGLDNT